MLNQNELPIRLSFRTSPQGLTHLRWSTLAAKPENLRGRQLKCRFSLLMPTESPPVFT